MDPGVSMQTRADRLVEKKDTPEPGLTTTEGPGWLLPWAQLVRGALSTNTPTSTILNSLLDAGWRAPNDPELLLEAAAAAEAEAEAEADAADSARPNLYIVVVEERYCGDDAKGKWQRFVWAVSADDAIEHVKKTTRSPSDHWFEAAEVEATEAARGRRTP